MTELLTAAEMRAVEQAAIDGGAVTGRELMERAGRGVVEALLGWRPALAVAPHRALVLCGPGNNGGDGFVVARLLRQRGWTVELMLLGDAARLPPDAAANAEDWRSLGEVGAWADRLPAERPDVVVDALFGTGLTRPVEGIGRLASLSRELCDRAPAQGAPWFVAVDIPSGLCADSGRAITRGDDQVFAHLTVTFHRPKPGHCLGQGPSRCGALRVVDIGLPPGPDQAARLVDREHLLAEGAPGFLGKHGTSHKYQHGHALVLSGGVGTGGAGRLAARGALRIGAGAVTVGAPPAAIIENAAHLDAIMLRAVRDLGAFLGERDAAKMNAVCLGPGLGVGEATRAAVAAACGSGRRVVLDADALTSFAEDPQALFTLLHEGCVLTPHRGEFSRVFPDLDERLSAPAGRGPAFSKLDATRDAAARAGCTVLLKGADTVIAESSGRAAVSAAAYERAAPWLATAGAGDVLAGFIAGLLARGWQPFEAACMAAWLHVECARRFGPGLIAEDLPEQLPGVFRDLGL